MTDQRNTAEELTPEDTANTSVMPIDAPSPPARQADPKRGAKPADSKLSPSEMQENLRKAEGDSDEA